MILQQAIMQLSKIENGKELKVRKLVLLWQEVGLCIHKAVYIENGSGYVISHFNSGKIVLRCIKTQEQAKEYMQFLKEILEDWTFTLKGWEEYPQIDKSLIKENVDGLQKEISGERR